MLAIHRAGWLIAVAVIAAPAVAQQVDLPSDPAGSMIVNVIDGTYEVRGSTIDGLRQTLRENALVDDDGRTALALSAITFDPDVTLGDVAERCSVVSAQIRIDVVMTLPGWREYRYGRANERQAWDRFLEALRLHEAEHIRLAELHGARFRDAAASLPPTETCEGLQAQVDRLLAAMKERHALDQLALDVRFRAQGRAL